MNVKHLMDVYESNISVKIENVPKRMDTGKGRDWHYRFVWSRQPPITRQIISCDWDGFETIEECLEDLILNHREGQKETQ